MNESNLGQLIDENAQRDAIHLAIAPVVAGERLYPGDHVGFVNKDIVAKLDNDLIGIVDPFLKKPVDDGQRFFLCLYPRSVTGMRHHWQHPSFGANDNDWPTKDKIAAEKIIRRVCADYGIDFDRLVESFKSGGSYCHYDDNHPGNDVDLEHELVEALSTYTGKSKTEFYFRCAC